MAASKYIIKHLKKKGMERRNGVRTTFFIEDQKEPIHAYVTQREYKTFQDEDDYPRYGRTPEETEMLQRIHP